MTKKSNVAVQAGWLALTTIFSYGLGLLRDRLLAAHFGAGLELDVYNSAFLIPDMIMNLLAAALTTAFIPVFTSYRQRHGLADAWRSTNIVMNSVMVVLVSIILCAYILMPWLTLLVAPGFDVAGKQLLTQTSRLLLLSPVAFALSIVLGGALQGVNRFFTYALSPVLYNLGIVVGIIWFVPHWGIMGVIAGVVIGAWLHMIVRYIELRRAGWHWHKQLDWHNTALHQTVRLMLPRIAGLLTVQANLWIYNAFASTMIAGSITVFNLARNFQSLPVSLFAIALATVIFPKLSEHFAAADQTKLVDLAQRAIRQLLYYTIPATVGVILVSTTLIKTFLGSGKFDQTAIQATSVALMVFALSIPLESMQHILARVFYAQHNTTTPVKITIIGLGVNALTCFSLGHWFGVIGLVLGFVFTAFSQVILLHIALRRRQQNILQRSLLNYLVKITIISLIMAGIIWCNLVFWSQTWLQLIMAVVCGAVTYGLLSYWLHIPEFRVTVKALNHLWQRVLGILSLSSAH